VAAIPENVRGKYLNILRGKRSHASGQKNFRLVKLIYEYILEDKIHEWKPAVICNELDISYGVLRCYKSLFLRGLKEYYYNWAKIKFELYEKHNNFRNNVLLFEIVQARKMIEIGMRKEAKTIFLKIERRIEDKTIEINYPVLSEIYEYLIDYYFNQRNLPRFNFYFEKLRKLRIHLNSTNIVNISQDEKILLNIRFYNALAFKSHFYRYNDLQLLRAVNYYRLAISESIKIKNTHHQMLFIYRAGNILEILNKNNEAYSLFKEGFELAKQKKFKIGYYAFKSAILYCKFLKSMKNKIGYKNENRKCYKIVQQLNQHSNWYGFTASNYISMLHYLGDEEEESIIEKEFIDHLILYPSIKRAWFEIYFYKLIIVNLFDMEMVKDYYSGKNFMKVSNVYLDRVIKMEKWIQETLRNTRNVYTINFTINIYINQLLTEFLKGSKIDFEKCEVLIRKIKWAEKTRHTGVDQSIFATLVECLNLMEKSIYYGREKNLKKYIPKIKQLVVGLMNSKYEFNIHSCYIIICLTAQQINNEELWSIVRIFYSWIEKTHPEILEPIMKKIRNREHNRYIVSGTEAA
jgi:hypothetical protein